MGSDDGDMWRAHKAASQDRRASNREQSAARLRSEGIPFTEHNNGAHLVVEGVTGFIDFWPGTGKWKTRDFPPVNGFGVRGLINLIKGPI